MARVEEWLQERGAAAADEPADNIEHDMTRAAIVVCFVYGGMALRDLARPLSQRGFGFMSDREKYVGDEVLRAKVDSCRAELIELAEKAQLLGLDFEVMAAEGRAECERLYGREVLERFSERQVTRPV